MSKHRPIRCGIVLFVMILFIGGSISSSIGSLVSEVEEASQVVDEEVHVILSDESDVEQDPVIEEPFSSSPSS